MSGFIALTTCEWIESLTHTNPSDTVVFWRKRKSFKAIKPSEYIYFLKRGPFVSNQDRYLIGRGKFIGTDLLLANEAWEKYGTALGFDDRNTFLCALQTMYRESNPELGCVLMKSIKLFRRPISLEEAGICFSPYIVSGKTITKEECLMIESIDK